MKRARAWLPPIMSSCIALVLSGCGNSDQLQPLPLAPPHSDQPEYQEPNVPPELPSPMTDACAAPCAKLEVTGPVSELAPPYDASGGQSTIGFGADHWYVAWGGRPSLVTQLQRFTKDGQPVGATKRIAGTTPGELEILSEGAKSEVLLWGWIPPAYAPTGIQSSLHRFDADLAPIGSPLNFRATGRIFGTHATEIASGKLTTTALHARTVPLVREVTIDLAAGAGSTPLLRDWHVPEAGAQAGDFSLYERIDDEGFLVFYSKRAIRIAALDADGTVSNAFKVLEANFEDDNVIVTSKRIAGTWWVGGFTARAKAPTTFHMVRVDPKKRTSVGEQIAFKWPDGSPGSLVDANGTPMLSGMIGTRQSLVPIDLEKRALCRPMTVPGSWMRAIHFADSTAGAVIDATQAGSPQRMHFARLACRAN